MVTKRSIVFVMALAVVISFLSMSLAEARWVQGYYQSDRTYVKPHYRTNPDGNPYNNYSFPGNYNPNIGRITPGNPDTYINQHYNRSYQRPYKPYNHSPLR